MIPPAVERQGLSHLEYFVGCAPFFEGVPGLEPISNGATNAALVVQNALELGLISAEQATAVLAAIARGEAMDAVEWMSARGLIGEAAVACLLDLAADAPSPGDALSPFEPAPGSGLAGRAEGASTPQASAEGAPTPPIGGGAPLAVTADQAPSEGAPGQPISAHEVKPRAPAAARPRDDLDREEADTRPPPDLSGLLPVFGNKSSRETTAPEPGRPSKTAAPKPKEPRPMPQAPEDLPLPERETADAMPAASTSAGAAGTGGAAISRPRLGPQAGADQRPASPPNSAEERTTRTGRLSKSPRQVPSKSPRSRPGHIDAPPAPGSRPGARSDASHRPALSRSPQDGAAPAEPGAEGLSIEQPGRYTFRYLHASGGQARILLVHDEQIGRDVALKEVSLDEIRATDRSASRSSLTSAEMQRLLREARVTGQLEHPNIVPVYDLGRRRDGALYYTMRFVRGVTLSQRLKACKTLGERLRLLKPFLDLCNAIAYAHSRGVIHRDLKPANAMVGEFGETVLLDWGIAKVTGREEIRSVDISNEAKLLQEPGIANTVAGEAIGTPGYMSPEQAKGLVDEIDERTDVFGLGAILYQILTGSPPYRGGNEEELLVRAQRGKITGVLRLSKDAPRPLAAIAEKALRAEKADRYQSAKEIAEEIDAYMTGGRVSAYAYSSRELLARFARQHRLLISSAALLFVVVCAALVAVTVSLRRQQEANAALAASREQEHRERLGANLNLADMHARAAERFIAQHRFASAANSALFSLKHNPAHPKSDYFSDSPQSWSERARFLRVLAASALYQARLRNFVSTAWTFVGDDAFTAPIFSPDEKWLAAGSYDARLRIWDLETGTLAAEFKGHESRITSLDWSPDGRLVASAAQEPKIIVWDARTGEQVRVLEGHRRAVRAVAFSTDGRLVASAGVDGSARIWEVSSGRELRRFTLESDRIEINDVAFSADDAFLLLGCADGTLRRFSILADAAPETLLRRSSEIWTIEVLQNTAKRRLLAAGRTEKGIVEIDERGRPTLTLEGHGNGISDLAYGPEGKHIASSSYDGTVRIWSALSGAPVLTLEGHDDFVSGLAFSKGKNLLASTSFDKTVRIWRKSDIELPQFVGHTEAIHSLAYSSDGSRIASGSWDKTVRVWNAADGHLLQTLRGHASIVTDVVFSSDGRRLLSASRDGTARVWNAGDGTHELTLISPDGGEVEAAVFSPDGELVATGSGVSGHVCLWDARTGALRKTLVGHRGLVSGLAFSRDGRRLASSSRDKSVIVFDVSSGEVIGRLEGGHGDWISDIKWGLGDRTLLTAGKDGLAIKWDVASATEITRFVGHGQWVNAVEISRSGRLLATASDDKTVRVWNAETGELLLIVNTVLEATGIAFSNDEKTLAVGDGTILALYPMDFSLLDVDPRVELASSSRLTEMASGLAEPAP